MSLRYVIRLVAVAAIYVAVARIALSFDAVAGFATPVWPPTGLAIAVTIHDRRLWPAVLAGAFAVNALTGAPILSAVGIGCGNTAEAVVAAVLLGRITSFDRAFADVRSVIVFTGIAAIGATLVSAVIGTLGLLAGGVIASSQMFETWTTWWVGDALGAIVVVPLVFSWSSKTPYGRSLRTLEGILSFALLGAMGIFVFVANHGPLAPLQQPYATFPVLVWIALRFGPRGASTATLVIASFAIASSDLVRAGLVDIQVYIGFVASTFLVLAAAGTERVRATRDADQANEVKTNFLRLVSHELRSPLATIFLQIERLQLIDEPEAARKKVLAGMRAQGDRLHHLVDAILEYTKLQSGKLSLAIETCAPRSLIGDCVAELRAQADAKQLALAVDAEGAPATFRTDPHLLRMAIINVIANAVKFTSHGGISVLARRDGDALAVEITDTGPGISEENRRRVFEPFEQLGAVRGKGVPGVGLGLTLAREMTTALGGTILLRSTVGTGSTFVLRFPEYSDEQSNHHRG